MLLLFILNFIEYFFKFKDIEFGMLFKLLFILSVRIKDLVRKFVREFKGGYSNWFIC